MLSDVLEHLYNPWRVLSQLKDLLTQSGHLLISVPNIQNLQYLNAVNSRNFYYQKTGLFDETHIRFFSFTALKNYLAEIDFRVLKNGWRPDLSLQSIRSGIETEIRENNYANLQIGNLEINISDATLDEYFGQQILICATHE
ncbi:methyltransferase domain-containing protein [Polynucleobacter necessarius]|uniref:methyltransferase domain-containing protein n=1 Tax=Polynucleobacter necessarius TaxID=576610 RepID=UPI0039E51941